LAVDCQDLAAAGEWSARSVRAEARLVRVWELRSRGRCGLLRRRGGIRG
jgi:hypothetical protein